MKTLVIALKIFLLMIFLTGVIYPLVVTGIAKAIFPGKADGSLLIKDNRIIGSKLIGQNFDSDLYFAGRPSATTYNTRPSGGSNLGLSNTKLKELVDERRVQFIRFNELDSLTEVPSEMLFASASGLDPHISLQAAVLQVERVAKARRMNVTQKQQLLNLVNTYCEKPQFGFLGEERVNVLLLNAALDKLE
jgi:K+-transporting ATPase ATPase C chain